MCLATLVLLSLLTVCTVSKIHDDFPQTKPHFENAVKSKFYVDKTLLVKEFLESSEDVSFITCPPSFGKSLNLQMLKRFLEIQVNENGTVISNKSNTKNYELFRNTKIFKEHPIFFEKHFGTYPVVFITFIGFKNILRGLYRRAREMIAAVYSDHRYLVNATGLWSLDLPEEYFSYYVNPYAKLNLSLLKIEYALKFLSKLLYKHFKTLPIILIDDYDALLISFVFKCKYKIKRTLLFYSSLMRFVFGHNPPLFQKVFCTGTLHLFNAAVLRSDFNLEDYSFLHHHRYSPYYGIREEQISELVRLYTNDTSESEDAERFIKEHCGGYNVIGSDSRVFGILSVLKHLKMKQTNHNDPNMLYWVKRKLSETLVPLLCTQRIKKMAVLMLSNKIVKLKSHLSLTVKDLVNLKLRIDKIYDRSTYFVQYDHYSAALLFLLHHGYLTFETSKPFYNNETTVPEFFLKFPSLQVECEFKRMLRRSIFQVFRLNTSLIKDIFNDIDEISESNCSELNFNSIFVKFDSFIRSSKYSTYRRLDFKMDLFVLLDSFFDLPFTPIVTNYGNSLNVNIEFKNRHNVTFFVEAGFILSSNITAIVELRLCSKAVMMKMNRLDYAKPAKRNNSSVAYMGICLAVTKRRPWKRVSIGFSTNFKPFRSLERMALFPVQLLYRF